MIIEFILFYWFVYIFIHVLCGEELTYTAQAVKMRAEERRQVPSEEDGNGGDAFSWALHGLTKD